MASILHRIVLFAGQDIGFELVQTLHARGDLALFVVTTRTVRDDINGYRSAIDACRECDVPVIVTSRVDDKAIEQIRRFGPDLILSAYYPHRIPAALVPAARLGVVNLHPGLLPRYRGKFPTPWYILNGELEFGLALHRIVDDGIDTGPVLIQARYPLSPTITGHELLRETMREGSALIAEHLSGILDQSFPERPQEQGGSYYSTIEKRYQIDWNASVSTIERRIRVHAKPYFPAYTFLMNQGVYINRAHPVSVSGFSAQGGGYILRADQEIIVSCADGCLSLDEFETYPELSSEQQRRLFQVGHRFE